MNRILTPQHFLCTFLIFQCLDGNFVIGKNGNRKFLLSLTDEDDDSKKSDESSDRHYAKGSVLIFKDPIIVNVQSLNRTQTEGVDHLKVSSMEKLSEIKASLCSLFRVCDFDFRSLFKILDYYLNQK